MLLNINEKMHMFITCQLVNYKIFQSLTSKLTHTSKIQLLNCKILKKLASKLKKKTE